MLQASLVSLVVGCRQVPTDLPPRPLAASDFVRIAAGGIDDRLNSYPWAVGTFDGDGDGEDELYVGTIGNALCLQAPLAAAHPLLTNGPPAVWGCDTTHWTFGLSWAAYLLDNAVDARIYRGIREPSGAFSWERVFAPGLFETAGFRGATVFDGALYMAGTVLSGGAVIWRTTDGVTWEKASDRGVIPEHASITASVRALTSFDGRLYAASASAGFVYASSDPAPGSWELVNSEGMVASGGESRDTVYFSGTASGPNTATTLVDSTQNFVLIVTSPQMSVRLVSGTGAGQIREVASFSGSTIAITEAWDPIPDETTTYEVFRADAPVNGPFWDMAVMGDRLYAAPLNLEGGELWYATEPAVGQWTRVIRGGAGQPRTQGFMDLTVHGDHLYLGTVVYAPLVDDTTEFVGTEVLRVDAADRVELLVGETRDAGTPQALAPLSGMGPGFDYNGNLYGWEGVSYGGDYYLGTFDGALLALDPLEALFPDGLPAELEAKLEADLSADHERWGGFDLYTTADGVHWTALTTDGFGNRDNYGVRALTETPWGLLLGAANPFDGFELWLAEPP